LTFDDEVVLARAVDDPIGFVDALPHPAVVDEFQRAGSGFLLAVKQSVDRDRRRGQLLLSGSANYLADRSVTETLAGRAGRLTVWPLSTGERRGIRETFVDRLFEPEAWPPEVKPVPRPELIDMLLTGGYPEVVAGNFSERQRRDWFEAYVHDVVSREALRPMVEIRLETELRRLARLVAARSGGEMIVSGLAADAEIGRDTASNYLALLEALHLITILPQWSSSATTSAKRRPKVVMADSGLAADLCGTGQSGVRADRGRCGGRFGVRDICHHRDPQTGDLERAER